MAEQSIDGNEKKVQSTMTLLWLKVVGWVKDVVNLGLFRSFVELSSIQPVEAGGLVEGRLYRDLLVGLADAVFVPTLVQLARSLHCPVLRPWWDYLPTRTEGPDLPTQSDLPTYLRSLLSIADANPNVHTQLLGPMVGQKLVEKALVVDFSWSAVDYQVFQEFYERSLGTQLPLSLELGALDSTLSRKHSGSFFTRAELCQAQVRLILEPFVRHQFLDTAKRHIDALVADPSDLSPLQPLNKNLQSFFQTKILDPSMGAGSYLQQSFHILRSLANELLEHLKSVAVYAPQHWYQITANTPIPANLGALSDPAQEYGSLLRPSLYWYVLSRMLYGVDLDPKAVMVAQELLLLTYLRSLGSMPQVSTPSQSPACLLPNLVAGNALVSPLPPDNRGTHFLVTGGGGGLSRFLTPSTYSPHTLVRSRLALLEATYPPEELATQGRSEQTTLFQAAQERLLSAPLSSFPISLRSYVRGYRQLQPADRSFLSPLIWQIQFPEVFFDPAGSPLPDDRAGFDLVVGNPPWEKSKLEVHEWVQLWGVEVGKQESGRALAKALWEQDPVFREDWVNQKERFKRLHQYYKVAFPLRGGGDFNLYKLFLERFLCLTKQGGKTSALVPLSVLTDYYGADLRATLLNETELEIVVEVVTGGTFFPDVMKGFNAAVIQAHKGGRTQKVTLVPQVQDLDHLGQLMDNMLPTISFDRSVVDNLSPTLLLLPLIRDTSVIPVLAKLQRFPRLAGDEWGCRISRGFDRTLDKGKLFSEDPSTAVPMLEGLHINRYGSTTNTVEFYALSGVEEQYPGWGKQGILWQISPGRNVMRRRLNFAPLPPKVVTSNKLGVILDFPTGSIWYLLGLLNSLVTEFRVRLISLGADVANFIVEELPVPPYDSSNPLHQTLAQWVESVVPKACQWADKRVTLSTKARADLEKTLTDELVHGDALAALVFGLTTEELEVVFTSHPKVWPDYKAGVRTWFRYYLEQFGPA